MNASTPIEIIVADDHPYFLVSLKAIVKDDPDITIIGEASDGHQLIKLARELKPSVIITDIMMPGITGIEATKVITRELPGVGIIALSMVEKENLIIEML